MIVTFISECQKNSLKLTREVLDAYAHRIGQRTWQSIMTEQGLQAVRSRLSKTARRTTAVACHRVCGTRRTELLWTVGNRQLFDDQGNVPTNRTSRDLLREHDENDWQYLGLLKGIVAISSLFHDFGKSWKPFQKMLRSSSKSRGGNPDPIRHEWISLLLFLSFTTKKPDGVWLAELAGIKSLSLAERNQIGQQIVDYARLLIESVPGPFKAVSSPLVQWIGWLIVSHHKLPHLEPNQFSDSLVVYESNLLERIRCDCGYQKNTERSFDLATDWKFDDGLPVIADSWCKEASRWGRKLGDELSLFDPARLDELAKSQRILLTLSRLALMLGDHEYSSVTKIDPSWPTTCPLFANTTNGTLRQRLDEHLVRVTDAAVKVTHLLPAFETQLPTAQNLRSLRKPSPVSFAWQNRAVAELRGWQKEHGRDDSGFFAVNMASTGKGKTFANAKIMDAIRPEGLRYSLALGLRTLTLQTGVEYREKLRLDANELTVMIGSSAVRALHEQRQSESTLADTNTDGAGSESAQALSSGFEFQYDDLIPDDAISTIVSDRKGRQLLKSPVLVCTVDHLMPAVEGTRGGRQILPMLRMLSADLVIDEVDDFDHADMPAIARLVHLAGMLGRKVMVSSATIPPAIAEGLFHAYREGWNEFARFRNRSGIVHAFWVDEFAAVTERISDEAEFQVAHERYVNRRIRNLNKQTAIARRAIIQRLSGAEALPLQSQWYRELTSAAIELHRGHGQLDPASGKRISIGIIRVANVDPCIDLAKFLLSCDLPDDIDVRVMAYHARQVLLLRSEQERHLDDVLNRKASRNPLEHPVLHRHILASDKSNIVFVVVATPVAEVGRDHDYDWAVVEPSSMRSIIQMAGRVWRHRDPAEVEATANIVIPDLNFKAFTGNRGAVFERPGFEGGSRNRGGGYHLVSKHLSQLVDVELFGNRLDASSRISCPSILNELTSLVHLEHRVLRNILTEPDMRPAFVRGWTNCAYYLSDVAQCASRFRDSTKDSSYKLHLTDTGEMVFRHVDPSTGQSDGLVGKTVTHLHVEELPEALRDRLWLSPDYASLIESQQHKLNRSRLRTCEFLGELNVIDREGQQHFTWNADLGARTC